jgi:hypothetical protein
MSTATTRTQAALACPAAARLDHFRSYTVAHPLLKAADDAAMQALREPAGASILIVVGPSGVGKTTLQQRLIQRVTEAIVHDPGAIPIVGLEAVAPDSGHFSWKDYYVRILTALDEPLVAHKRAAPSGRWAATGYVLGGHGVVAPELRRALDQALCHRQPAAVVVDEAQHLVKMASGRRLQDQFDHIKSLASTTGVLHILVGTYDLLALRHLSGQLSRRSLIIHFPRYRCERAEEVHAFKSVLQAFQRRVPLRREPDLLRHWEYCYERSIGCVGVLKDWLTRALARALEEDAATLTLPHLQAHALAPSDCLTMATEARAGEQQLTEDPGECARLRTVLALTAGPATPPPVLDIIPRTPRRAGQRTPRRDPVGTDSHGR